MTNIIRIPVETDTPPQPPAAALPIPDGAERAEPRRYSPYFPVVVYYFYGKSKRGIWQRHGYTIEGKDVETRLLVGEQHWALVAELEAQYAQQSQLVA